MSPQAIVDTALACGLDLIAVTDHNTCAMAEVVARVAAQKGLSFLFGIELQTAEEVHLLAYFDDRAFCSAFSEEIYDFLPDIPNDPEYFGDQVVVDEDEEIVRVEPRLLINSLQLSLEETVARIRVHSGFAVPAHVDRAPFGLLVQLGFFPAELSFPLVEVAGDDVPYQCSPAAILRSSDAHNLEEIGRSATIFTIMGVSLEEIRLAAAGTDGRSVRSRSAFC